jgi:hypothetical protein
MKWIQMKIHATWLLIVAHVLGCTNDKPRGDEKDVSRIPTVELSVIGIPDTKIRLKDRLADAIVVALATPSRVSRDLTPIVFKPYLQLHDGKKTYSFMGDGVLRHRGQNEVEEFRSPLFKSIEDAYHATPNRLEAPAKFLAEFERKCASINPKE